MCFLKRYFLCFLYQQYILKKIEFILKSTRSCLASSLPLYSLSLSLSFPLPRSLSLSVEILKCTKSKTLNPHFLTRFFCEC
ncbi:unnamed protein product, partial [Vitis vinifera]